MQNKKEEKRTEVQNRALHKYFSQLSDALNSAGFDLQKTLKVDVPWTPVMVKELIWKKVQEVHLQKKSTKELTTKDIDKIYDVVNRAIGERTGVHVEFPSRNSAVFREREFENK